MAIPDYQTIMLPLLRFAGDQQEHSLREAIDQLAEKFALTEVERKELLPSRQQEIFNNRVAWARTYLGKAGLLESTRRGYFKITDRGVKVVKQNPDRIDVKFLDQFEEFRQFRALRHTKTGEEEVEVETHARTPEEVLESAYK